MDKTWKEIVALLAAKNNTIAIAESLTGGAVSAKLVMVAGASEVYKFGLVTYSNAAKQKFLGVKESTLRDFGAVSAETATEMAQGLLRLGADFALSTTGIAGPSTDEEFHVPLGRVFIGTAAKDGEAFARMFDFVGDREQVIAQAAAQSLKELALLLGH
ncbi:MAG: CinA family protein [Clostridia bacterium]|nr:CinA family protein [Clostridia bacterium]